jgi:hypothetical protein
MPFAYYERLSVARQRVYRKSDAIATLALPAGADVGVQVAAIRSSLASEDRAKVQVACQALVDALVAAYHVPPMRMRVLAKRRADPAGELYGLYEPGDDGERARITVWMRTAQRKHVVAFRTFLRTLVHEFCHHLDYEMFRLPETFHTEGFYKRESSLANALFAQEPETAALPQADMGAVPRPSSQPDRNGV